MQTPLPCHWDRTRLTALSSPFPEERDSAASYFASLDPERADEVLAEHRVQVRLWTDRKNALAVVVGGICVLAFLYLCGAVRGHLALFVTPFEFLCIGGIAAIQSRVTLLDHAAICLRCEDSPNEILTWLRLFPGQAFELRDRAMGNLALMIEERQGRLANLSLRNQRYLFQTVFGVLKKIRVNRGEAALLAQVGKWKDVILTADQAAKLDRHASRNRDRIIVN
jgi:hypothetical protein